MSINDKLLRAFGETCEQLGSVSSRLARTQYELEELKAQLHRAQKPATMDPEYDDKGNRIWPELTRERVAASVHELMTAMASGQKINAIKHVRNLTRCSLKEAKDLVEAVMQAQGQTPCEPN